MAEVLKSLLVRRRDDRWKRTLKANHPNLRHEIRVNDVLPRFHSFLTDVEYLRVQGSDKADNIDQVDQLFRILLTKEKREFEEFLVALWQQGYFDTAARLAEEAGVELNTSIGIPKSQKHAMKEKGMLYYPLIESLHDAFYKEVIIPFEAFVMKSTDADFRYLRRVCEQVIRREEHPIACKVHLPTQREEILDDLECKHGLWKDALEYQLLHEVIMAFHDEGLTLRLKQYEALLHKEGNTILMQCQREFRRCPDLYLVLKADHNTALATLYRMKSFLVNDVGLADASFAGFREGCIELFFRISSESASTALEPLCSHAFRAKLLSMGVRRVTLRHHWVINNGTGHVFFLQSPESLTDRDTEDSTADVTHSSEMTTSIAGHSGRLSDLEDVPFCKRVKLNPEEEDAPVFQPSHNIEWQAAQEDSLSILLQSEPSRSCVGHKGTSDDEETRVDGICGPPKVVASDVSAELVTGIMVPEQERSVKLMWSGSAMLLEELYLEGLPSRTVPKDYHSVSWPLQVEMEAEGRRRELVGDIMRLLVEIGSLKDGRPALGPLDLDNLEGTLREVKERNRQLREECGQMQSSWRREREQARSVNSIMCDLSDEKPKEEKLSFKDVKEQRTTQQVTKEEEVGEEEEDRSEDSGNRWKKKGYGGAERGEEELLVSREDEQERRRQKKENLALESMWKKATCYWPKLVAKVLPSSEVSDNMLTDEFVH